MIASVSGRVATLQPDAVVIEVGGVGLRVQCAPGTVARLQPGSEARLATSLVVREDALTLFGFADDDERGLFELLQTATGVGPRLALAVLATLAPDEVRRAVATGDTATLTRVPGVGRKGAERLVVELSDRLGPWRDPQEGQDPEIPSQPGQRGPVGWVGHGGPGAAARPGSWEAAVSDALVGLGWGPREAQAVVTALAEERAAAGETARPVGDEELGGLIRRALAMAGRVR